MQVAIYPGSFDPITLGHLDIIKRASKIFDKVIVAILINSKKESSFTVEERIDFIKRATKDIKNIEIEYFSGLLIDFAIEKNASIIIKGLRAVSDFEYEFQMALTNSKLCPNIETLFMATSTNYSYLSSSIVREVATLGGSLNELVPNELISDIVSKLKKCKGEK